MTNVLNEMRNIQISQKCEHYNKYRLILANTEREPNKYRRPSEQILHPPPRGERPIIFIIAKIDQ